MMRPHCDRCDALCDECQTRVDVPQETNIDEAATRVWKHVGDTFSRTWHITIHAGGQVTPKSPCPICKTDLTHPVYLGDNLGTCHGVSTCEEKMFCRACRIAVLEAYVKGLKEKA